MIIAVTGAKAAGKSASLLKSAEILKSRNVSVAGIISKRIWKEGKRYGYELIDLSSNSSQLLAAEEDLEGDVIKHCTFSFRQKALTDGVNAIIWGCGADVLIVDEVGNMEASGGGWSKAFPYIMKRTEPILLGVREDAVGKLSEMGLPPDKIITVLPENNDVSGIILKTLKSHLPSVGMAL